METNIGKLEIKSFQKLLCTFFLKYCQQVNKSFKNLGNSKGYGR